ncbi:MAG: O-antigen ligase family protein [Coriobacteriia bacterium]|nr:O-antigen ligase family protein [Coriobacteriia bacterium]
MFAWIKEHELSIAGKISWGLLLLAVFLVPITFAQSFGGNIPFVADMFDTPKIWLLRVLTPFMFVAWGADILFNGGKIRINKVALALIGILGVIMIASTIASIEPMQSFFGKYRRYDGLWSYFIYVALLWVTMQYATSTKRVKQIMQTLSATSIIVAGYGLLQAIGIDPFEWGSLSFEVNRSFSTYGNPNLLAGFLAFGLFINLGLALSETEQRPRIYYWVATLLNAAVMVTAFSRSIWVGAVVALVLFIAIAIRQRIPLNKTDGAFVGATVLAAGAFVVRSLFSDSNVMNVGTRIVSIFEFGEGSAQTRFQIWQAAIDATKERPLLGWGPDTFRMVFRWFQPYEYNRDAGYRSVADNAHNYPLHMAATVGVVGAVCFYILQLWVVVSATRYLWKRPTLDTDVAKNKREQERDTAKLERARRARIMYAGVLAAVVAYMIHLFFGLSLPGATFLLWVFMGVMLVPTSSVREIKPVGYTAALATTIVCVVLAGIPVYYATNHLRADNRFMQARVYASTGQYTTALTTLQDAIRFNPYNDQYAIEYVQVMLRAAAQGQATFEQVTTVTELLMEAFSNEYDVYLLATWVYEALAREDEQYLERGLEIAREAVEIYPHGLALRFTYVKLLELAGEHEAALTELEFITAADPRFKDAREMLEELRSEELTETADRANER